MFVFSLNIPSSGIVMMNTDVNGPIPTVKALTIQ